MSNENISALFSSLNSTNHILEAHIYFKKLHLFSFIYASVLSDSLYEYLPMQLVALPGSNVRKKRVLDLLEL